MMLSREGFEAWASRPPREWSLARQGDKAAWPGQYEDYHVQCAWEAWQEVVDRAEKWDAALSDAPEVSLARHDADLLGELALKWDEEGDRLLSSHDAGRSALGRKRKYAASMAANESDRLRRQAEGETR